MLEIIQNLINDADFKSHVKFNIRHFAANEKIIEQDKIHNEMYLIKSGKVRVVVHTELKENTKIRPGIADLGPNDIFGEFGLLDELPASAEVIAVDDSELIEIDIRSFRHYLAENPQLGYRILLALGKTLVTRLRHADKTIINLYVWGMKANKLDKYLENDHE